MNIGGLIPLVAGIYALLRAIGFLPRNPMDPEAAELWRQKHAGLLTFAGLIMMIHGLVQLAGAP